MTTSIGSVGIVNPAVKMQHASSNTRNPKKKETISFSSSRHSKELVNLMIGSQQFFANVSVKISSKGSLVDIMA